MIQLLEDKKVIKEVSFSDANLRVMSKLRDEKRRAKDGKSYRLVRVAQRCEQCSDDVIGVKHIGRVRRGGESQCRDVKANDDESPT